MRHKAILVIATGVLAVLLFLYGVSILLIGSGSRFYLVWMLLAVCMAALAVALQWDLLVWIPVPLRRTFVVLVLAGLAVVCVTFGLMLSQFHADGTNDPDVILVLGAQVRPDGPSRVLRYRLDTAYDYLEAHPETICIVSGGQGVNEPEPEAEGMARYLVERGIDSAHIRIENQSVNTAENMAFSKAFLDPDTDRIGIVTNNFHVYRSLSLARKAGYRNVSGIAAPSDLYYLPNNMLRETCGLLKDWIVGNL